MCNHYVDSLISTRVLCKYSIRECCRSLWFSPTLIFCWWVVMVQIFCYNRNLKLLPMLWEICIVDKVYVGFLNLLAWPEHCSIQLYYTTHEVRILHILWNIYIHSADRKNFRVPNLLPIYLLESHKSNIHINIIIYKSSFCQQEDKPSRMYVYSLHWFIDIYSSIVQVYYLWSVVGVCDLVLH